MADWQEIDWDNITWWNRRDFAKKIDVPEYTVTYWDESGKLKADRGPTGIPYYTQEHYDIVMGWREEREEKERKEQEAQKPVEFEHDAEEEDRTVEATRIIPDTSGEGTAPWDRRLDEPPAAYQAFVAYLHCPHPRYMSTAYNAWKELMADDELPYTQTKGVPQAWKDWKIVWAWDERCDEYDKFITGRISEVIGDARTRAEYKVRESLMVGLDTVTDRIRKATQADFDAFTLQAAIYALPRLTQEIRLQLGLQHKEKTPLEEVLKMFPPEWRQKLLIAINVENVNIGDGKKEKPQRLEGEIVEGEILELTDGENE